MGNPQTLAAENSSPPTNPTNLPQVAANRFVLNFASNLAYLVLSTGLMLWYVPFLIDRLGVAAYGMVPLANSLVMFTAILSSSLDVSINRFLAIDLNRADFQSANNTLNTALALSLIACGVLLIPATILVWFFPSLFQVPAGLENQTRVLFAAVMLTTLASIISANFAVSSLVFHRFDLRNLVRGLALITRLGLVAVLFWVMQPQLWHVAAGLLAAVVIGLSGDILVWRHLTPQLALSAADIRRERMREMLGLGSWSIINQTGLLLMMQIDLALTNVLYGPVLTGVYGSLLMFPQLVHTLTDTVISILSPTIMGLYANKDMRALQAYAIRSMRLLGLTLALPVGLLCGLGGALIRNWLGPEFEQYHLLLVVMVIHLGVNLATRPLSYVLTAYNRVRTQGLVTLGLGIANIGLALALSLWFGLGILGVAVALAIVWTLRSVVFLPVYTARIVDIPAVSFIAPLVPGLLATVAIAAAGMGLYQWWPMASWLELMAAGALIGVVALAVILVVGLSPDDRRMLMQQATRIRSRA